MQVGGEKMSDGKINVFVEFGNFIEGKHVLLRYFTKDSLEKIDKQILLERMVENTVEDIVTFNRLRGLSGEYMDNPLTVVEQERLKKKILEKLMS